MSPGEREQPRALREASKSVLWLGQVAEQVVARADDEVAGSGSKRCGSRGRSSERVILRAPAPEID